MRVLNKQVVSDVRQRPVGGIEEAVSARVVLWPDPFAFQHSPQGLRDIQMRGIWWQEENVKSPVFPYQSESLNGFVAMYGGIVQHDECLLAYSEGEIIEEGDNLVGRHSLCGRESFIPVASGNHTEDIEPCYSLGRNVHALSFKLPSVGNIPLGTSMALIAIIEFYAAFFGLALKFLQLLDLILVELRRGDSPWAFSYTLISCANADKKRLKVNSLASLPVACSQAALALLTLCRSSSMARWTASSSEQSMIGLRPRPGRVSRPLMPSLSKRRTHDRTAWDSISVCSPTLAAERPEHFRSTARQRIRKQCFAPCRKPCSNSRRSASVRDSCLIFPIVSTPIYNRTQKKGLYFMQINFEHLLTSRNHTFCVVPPVSQAAAI